MQELQMLTDLAFQYGPFLFALLFNLVITRWGHQIYNQACERKDPPASEREKDTYRLYFISMAAFGIALVVASIVWWVVAYRPPLYVFEGQIKGLREYEQVTSNSLYFKPVFLRKIEPEAPQQRDEIFVVVQREPFQAGQEFDILFSKGSGQVEEFVVVYEATANPKYRVEWDEERGHSVLRRQELTRTSINSGVRFSLFSPAYADTGDSGDSSAPPLPRLRTFDANRMRLLQAPLLAAETESASPLELLHLLQAETSGVGSKIDALRKLQALSETKLQALARTDGLSEPFLLTLLDLGRHTDKELAFNARRLSQLLRPDETLRAHLGSGTPEQAEQAAEVVRRIELSRAQKLLEGLNTPAAVALREAIERSGTQVLVPTGSAQGDRYYVEVSWNSDDAIQLSCLANLFSAQLPGVQSEVKNQMRLMSQLDKRLIYGHSKAWALSMDGAARACGATTQFLGVH